MFRIFIILCVFIKIILAKAPEVVPFGTILNVEQFEQYLLLCTVSKGTKPIQFEWFKNGAKIDSSNSEILLESKPFSSNVLFENVQPEYSGNYSCKASNSDGYDFISTILQVKGLFLDSFPFGGAKNAEIFVEYFLFFMLKLF
mgnify:CR=1 FL=1